MNILNEKVLNCKQTIEKLKQLIDTDDKNIQRSYKTAQTSREPSVYSEVKCEECGLIMPPCQYYLHLDNKECHPKLEQTCWSWSKVNNHWGWAWGRLLSLIFYTCHRIPGTWIQISSASCCGYWGASPSPAPFSANRRSGQRDLFHTHRPRWNLVNLWAYP